MRKSATKKHQAKVFSVNGLPASAWPMTFNGKLTPCWNREMALNSQPSTSNQHRQPLFKIDKAAKAMVLRGQVVAQLRDGAGRRKVGP